MTSGILCREHDRPIEWVPELVARSGRAPEPSTLLVSDAADTRATTLFDAPRDAPPSSRPHREVILGRLEDRLPLLLVGGAVLFTLCETTAETTWTPLLNDGSMHAQMVRYAARSFRSGHLPLKGWYPYLGLGSPQFLHYQSLGAMLAGLVGLVIGADHAFNWSLYLLVALWPISVYAAARVFQLGRWPAAIAAACAPFLASVPAVGYEQYAYLWSGYGLWSQLFAMWTLPLAWAFSWRAVRQREYVFCAVATISLTIGFHFMTGYLAVAPLVLWLIIEPSQIRARLVRAVGVGAGALIGASWVIVPLVQMGKWTSINEFLQGGPDANSYGARQVLAWLVNGNLFDRGRLPVITILVAVGLVASLARLRTDSRARAVVALFVLSLLLFFGRTTFGALFDLLPGSKDLFLRRFMMGVQLAGLLLAGIGGLAIGRGLSRGAAWFAPTHAAGDASPQRRVLLGVGAVGLVALALAPAWSELGTFDTLDGSNIAYQQLTDISAGFEVNTLAARMAGLGAGRVYAGLPTNWGASFRVGEVPVFKYLSNLDYDVVGYTLRTASLMTDPEANFDASNAGDYALFGIRYLMLPAGMAPPTAASLIAQRGPYTLWEIPQNSYVQVVDTVTPISADRADIGVQTVGFLDSSEPGRGLYPTVAFAGQAPAAPTVSGVAPSGAAGAVLSEHIDLVDGHASARVSAERTSVVLLKVTYDPGWTTTVDGEPVTPEMVAPALVGVEVAPGVHTVTFRYIGYRHYPLLLTISAAALAGVGVDSLRRRRAAHAERGEAR